MASQTESAGAHNLQRLSVYLILAVLNAGVFFAYIRTPANKTDYVAFYVAGQTARTAPAMVYDFQYQGRTQIRQFNTFLPFFHPPHELLLFSPFSMLPFSQSLNSWRIFCLLCIAGSGFLLAKATGIPSATAVAAVSAIFAVPLCVLEGQDSLLLLFIASCTFYLLKRDADVAAGLILAMALFKPQLPVILALALLAFRRTRFAISFFSAASVLTVASLAYVGREGLRKLLECTRLAEQFLPIYSMPTFRGLLARYAGDHQKLSSAAFILGLLVFFLIWRRAASLEFVFATATCFYSFAALHLYVQDLVILAIPILLYSKLPKYRHDGLLLVAFFSFPLFLILTTYNVYALQVIPSIALCAACFRLRTKEQALTVSA